MKEQLYEAPEAPKVRVTPVHAGDVLDAASQRNRLLTAAIDKLETGIVGLHRRPKAHEYSAGRPIRTDGKFQYAADGQTKLFKSPYSAAPGVSRTDPDVLRYDTLYWLFCNYETAPRVRNTIWTWAMDTIVSADVLAMEPSPDANKNPVPPELQAIVTEKYSQIWDAQEARLPWTRDWEPQLTKKIEHKPSPQPKAETLLEVARELIRNADVK